MIPNPVEYSHLMLDVLRTTTPKYMCVMHHITDGFGMIRASGQSKQV